jgi:hypothetical protein
MLVDRQSSSALTWSPPEARTQQYNSCWKRCFLCCLPISREPKHRIDDYFPGCTPVRDLHTAFNLSLYIHNYITKLCRRQAEVIQDHENQHVRSTREGEAIYRKYKRLKIGVGQPYDRSSDKLPLYHKISKIGMICSVKSPLTENLCVVQN